MTPSITAIAVVVLPTELLSEKARYTPSKGNQNTLQNFEVSHPIAFSRAHLLATCFCVFSFIFPKLHRANTYRPPYSNFLSKACQHYARRPKRCFQSADIVNRTRTTFLLDSLASYWNTFIPYRQICSPYL